MFCARCRKNLVDCTCPDIEDRLKSLAGEEGTAFVASSVMTDRAIKKAAGPQPLPDVEFRKYFDIKTEAGKSPVVRMQQTPKARAWAKQVLKDLEESVKDRIGYWSPEHMLLAQYSTMKYYLDAFLADKAVTCWDAHRELHKQNPHLNAGGHAQVCGHLFG